MNNKNRKPTVKDVSLIINEVKEIYKIPELDTEKLLQKLLGVGDRSIRRWKAKALETPYATSIISFSEWAKLILLARNEKIFNSEIKKIKQSELNIIATDLICNSQQYKGCSAEQFTLFVGKNSFTGLTRGELCKVFKWDVKKFSSDIENEKISFSMVSMTLILCGVDKDKLFNLK